MINKLAVKVLKLHQEASKQEALRLREMLDSAKAEVKSLETQILHLISDITLVDESIQELEGKKEYASKSKKIKR